MTYALGRASSTTTCRRCARIVRDASAEDYRFSAIVAGIVRQHAFQMRGVPDGDHEPTAPTAAASTPTDAQRTHAMFITKKHLSRRTVLAACGARRAAAARRDDSGRHRARADRRGAEAAHGILLLSARRDHGQHAGDALNVDAGQAADFELTPILEPLAPFKKYMTVVSGLGNKPGRELRVHAIMPGTWLSCVQPRDQPDAVRRRHVDQIAAAAHRPGHAAAVARGRDRGSRAAAARATARTAAATAHDLVPHADHAAADGARSAQGVRAALRPGRDAGGAHGASRATTRACSTWCTARRRI